jgi:hypothetical protein
VGNPPPHFADARRDASVVNLDGASSAVKPTRPMSQRRNHYAELATAIAGAV